MRMRFEVDMWKPKNGCNDVVASGYKVRMGPAWAKKVGLDWAR